MWHDPKINPKRGDRPAKVIRKKRGGGVFSRIVLGLEARVPCGTTVVYTRKNPLKPCRCALSEWKRWARSSRVPGWPRV
jgi:hypothetical protein